MVEGVAALSVFELRVVNSCSEDRNLGQGGPWHQFRSARSDRPEGGESRSARDMEIHGEFLKISQWQQAIVAMRMISW